MRLIRLCLWLALFPFLLLFLTVTGILAFASVSLAKIKENP